jgi:hypothetical protein
VVSRGPHNDASVGDNAENPFALSRGAYTCGYRGRGFVPVGAQHVPVIPDPGAAPRHDDGPTRPKFTIPSFMAMMLKSISTGRLIRLKRIYNF